MTEVSRASPPERRPSLTKVVLRWTATIAIAVSAEVWVIGFLAGVLLLGIRPDTTGLWGVARICLLAWPLVVVPLSLVLFGYFFLRGATAVEVTETGIRVHRARGEPIDVTPDRLYRPVIDRGAKGMGILQFDNGGRRHVAYAITHEDALKLRRLPYYASLRLTPRFARNPKLLSRVERGVSR